VNFRRFNPAQLESARLATDDGLGCCPVLSERIRLASETITDGDRAGFAGEILRAAWARGRELSRDEAVAFITRPIHIVGGHSPMRPKAKKTRLQFSSELRRGVYHTLVRLPVVRRKAKATRLRAGSYYRKTVYPLIREAIQNGAKRERVRGEVRLLAAKRGIVIPSESQLGRIIKGFFEVDMTA
jgi:hypothetical protein